MKSFLLGFWLLLGTFRFWKFTLIDIVSKLAWKSIVSRARCFIKKLLLWQRFAKVFLTECPKVLTFEFCKLDREYLPLEENYTVEVSYLPGPGLGLIALLNLYPPESNLTALWFWCFETKTLPSLLKKLFC
jgi:hypothetical protein